MIRFSATTLRRGLKVLLEAADLTLNPGDKIGLIGANGTGKSSLFALLRGELQTDGGSLDYPPTWRVAHVAQETPAIERAAIDYAIDGDATVRELEDRLARAEAEGDGNAIGEIHGALADADAYTVRARAQRLLAGLGFTADQMDWPVSQFSGGWRMRLNLAQALMCPSDLLLLDEPTNHLDLDAIVWLEEWLKRYEGTLLIISHDRDFLDAVVGVIVHLEERKLKRYGGDYSAFERQRAAALALQAGMIDKQARQRAHLQSFVNRFKAQASKARQAQSRLKMLARMEDLAPLHAAAPFAFQFREPLSAPSPLLVMDQVDAGYTTPQGNAHVVVGNVTLSLQPGQRFGLLGINGAGKSTLLNTLVGALPPLSGKVSPGKGLVIGYFAQHQIDHLRPEASALWHLARLSPQVREQELRQFLGMFNFSGDMATQPIAPFSGGEKSRLALALIVWQRPNLLVLDEPTNHLDLETREALTLALAQFEGTLVLVSHDRHLLRATTDQFLVVANRTLQPFDGDLDDYRDALLKTRSEERTPKARATQATASPSSTQITPSTTVASASAPIDAVRLRQQQMARKPIENRLAKLDTELSKLNAERTELSQRLADPGIYEAAQRDRLKAALDAQRSLDERVAACESEWLSQQTLLDAIESAPK